MAKAKGDEQTEKCLTTTGKKRNVSEEWINYQKMALLKKSNHADILQHYSIRMVLMITCWLGSHDDL